MEVDGLRWGEGVLGREASRMRPRALSGGAALGGAAGLEFGTRRVLGAQGSLRAEGGAS